MGRGRGKGKKLRVSNEEDLDLISGEEEKVPLAKRRGRPSQKVFKDDFDEEVVEEIEEDDYSGEKVIKKVVSSNGRKRRKENLQEVEEKSGTKSKSDELTKCNGYRHRRKSKPRRAAEAGVQWKQDYCA
ncbi:FACT complex subunit Ssrp1 [Cajanus cajan]|uniref:Uncharacterized protein n=1 Tax=Cajanus cajan TaxID=3821 RepID=A0A151TMF9_CAJCA|nr:FACT complex subunit Ssrp1 [Cajanus cajan]KYP68254.1 hypothetical protein KK1_021874 [Cajanus cajan]